MAIHFHTDKRITVDAFRDLLSRSTLGERRPIDDSACLEAMLTHADILATAWDAERLVGVARCVTDFAYCCYLSDLAVDQDYQRQGIGQQLQSTYEALLGPTCTVILLAAPKAVDYYPHIGYEQHQSCWIKKMNLSA